MIPRLRLALRREPQVIAAYAVLVVVLAWWLFSTPNVSLASLTVSLGAKLPLVLVAIGATIAIIVKGIDLSVGGVLAVTNVIIARGGEATGDATVWILVALVVAAVVGMVNGALVGYLRLPSLIVTLAMQSLLLGVALYILPTPGGAVPSWFTALSVTLVGPIPLVLVLLVVFPIVIWYPIRQSRFGTALYAIGADPAAGYVAGINVARTTTGAFALSAVFAALGGVMLTTVTGSGDPNIGTPYTMNSIAAAVLGGVLLSGGRGTIAGAIAGALTLSFISNLLFSLGISTYWQYVVTGALLVAVLALPALIRRVRIRKEVASS